MRHHIVDPAVISDLVYHIVHIVRLVRVVRNDLVEFRDHPVYIVVTRIYRSCFHVVRRHVAQKFSDRQQCLFVIFPHKMRHAADRIVCHGPAELFGCHGLACYRLDDFRACYEHLAGLVHHEHEVRYRRRIHCAARAWSHYH